MLCKMNIGEGIVQRFQRTRPTVTARLGPRFCRPTALPRARRGCGGPACDLARKMSGRVASCRFMSLPCPVVSAECRLVTLFCPVMSPECRLMSPELTRNSHLKTRKCL